ncbi:MAG: hypothetical protein N3A56_08220, partial [Thermodesulfobacteriaceae bacterium]|nr:hypothetical protein [Thermodesulfobacteriaceae bacterium]
MKLLLVAYSFPPFQDPQALRWYYLTQVLVKLGLDIEVITVKNFLSESFQYSKDLKINKVFPGLIEGLALKKKSELGVERNSDKKVRYSFKFRLFKRGYKVIKKIFSAIFPGDYRTEWFPLAIRYITKNFDVREYQCILTSHEPAVDSLIGLYLKKKYKIKWIADFGDPYVAIYAPWYKLWLEKKLEEKIYKLADGLIFTGKSVVQSLKKRYPFLEDKKILILYQGYSLNFSKNLEIEKRNLEIEENFLNLFYAGTFYRGFREPEPLFEAVKSLVKKGFKIKLYIAGRNEEFLSLAKGFEDFIIFLGFLSHFLVLKSYHLFDILVGITNKTDLQIPGKFFEYFGFPKPIFCLT